MVRRHLRGRLPGRRQVPRQGQVGYAPAPVEKTDSSGWLHLGLGHPEASRNADKAWKFVSWASSKEYEQLVGDETGWSNVPAGKRASTTRTRPTSRRPPPSRR
ncbi:hypothetical protein STENM327S_06784 [Streptomyces tendae]